MTLVTAPSLSIDEAKLDARDKERVKVWRERFQPHDITKFKGLEKDDGENGIAFDGEHVLGLVGITEATGTADPGLANSLLAQAGGTFPRSSPAASANLALAALHDFKPQDVLEGQLASQMVGMLPANQNWSKNAIAAN